LPDPQRHNKTQFRVDTEKNIWNCFSECKHGGNTLDFICRARHELRAFFGQPKRIASHLQEADRNLTAKAALLDTHKREIAKAKEEMHQTHQLYLKQQISGDGFRDLYGPAEERLKQLQTELPKLEADVDLLNVNKLSADDVLHEATTLYDRWPTLPSDNKRRVVEAIIEKIVIGNGEIDITFSHVPSSEELCKSQSRLGNR